MHYLILYYKGIVLKPKLVEITHPVIKLLSFPENIPTDITFSGNVNSTSGTTYCSPNGLFQHSGLAACDVVRAYMKKNGCVISTSFGFKTIPL